MQIAKAYFLNSREQKHNSNFKMPYNYTPNLNIRTPLTSVKVEIRDRKCVVISNKSSSYTTLKHPRFINIEIYLLKSANLLWFSSSFEISCAFFIDLKWSWIATLRSKESLLSENPKILLNQLFSRNFQCTMATT